MKVIMKLLGVFSILAMTQAYPVNFTVQTAGPVPVNASLTVHAQIPVNSSGHIRGLCDFKKQNCSPRIGAQCPQCAADGNFLPEQCSSSTGYCWCVNVITGELIPNSTVPPGHMPPKCGSSSEEDSDSDSSSSEESSSKDGSDSSSSEETKEEKDSDSSSSEETKEEKNSESSSSDESKKTKDGSDSSSSEETKEEKDSDSSSSDESKKEKDESDSSSSEETKEEKDSDSSSSEETKEEKDSKSSSSDKSKKHKEESDSSSSEETKEEKDSDSSSSDESHKHKDGSDSSSSEETKEEKDSSSEETKEDKDSDSSSSEETKEDKDSDSSSSEENSGCPEDWTRFGEQCFIFVDSSKSWAEAESYCQFDGSNLASIHSYEENHFLQSLTRGDTHHFPQAWIGGTDTMHLGLWTWSDGSKFLYENWSDDGKDGESDRCLKINYHYELKWTAARCSESLPFVCSKNAEKENEA
ncbi:lisH domain-containing protein C1711.05 isoform X44 [Oryzias melastigma]|uniref:lisH domain-containing protein C1711.05 isoform X44 n=1 Tax=Oryzias melastigma TaxID=30732 RepID=UPI000CF81CC1|nr:lisH domain-containing protein C1711.05 isoform X44 [Oryzias melastigma]